MSGKNGIKTGINWNLINLNQPTDDICREFHCSRRSVLAARRRLGIEWPEEERGRQGVPLRRNPPSKAFGVTLKFKDAEKLIRLAAEQNHPPAKMARLLLEKALNEI